MLAVGAIAISVALRIPFLTFLRSLSQSSRVLLSIFTLTLRLFDNSATVLIGKIPLLQPLPLYVG